MAVVVLLALVAGYRALEHGEARLVAASPGSTPALAPGASPGPAPELVTPGCLYGRITAKDGTTYEGRMRFAGSQEAFWDDLFNGVKLDNPWAVHVPAERLKGERQPIAVLGIEIGERRHPLELSRPFQVRFGDLARLESEGREVRATLKSGTVVALDRLEAGDFDDGIRVWDRRRGVVDLEPLAIRTVEFLPTPPLAEAPTRLRGTVHTRQGELGGFVAWDRDDALGTDELTGRTAEGRVALRLDTIRSIARTSRDGLDVTLRDGRTLALLGRRGDGPGHRGIAVGDPRLGRAVVSWGAFERVDFAAPHTDPGSADPASGPAYGDFPTGQPLTGRLTTRGGRSLAGRLVFDLDESETTDTLDAPAHGVDYSVPFGLVVAIEPAARVGVGPRTARLTLHDGTILELDPAGDLGDRNGGMLVFVGGSGREDAADYVPWSDVARLDFSSIPAGETPHPGR